MDPIHPILPVPPNIPPVTEAPRVGKLDRDQRREPGDEAEKRQPNPRTSLRSASTDDEHAADGEPRPHIDVTA